MAGELVRAAGRGGIRRVRVLLDEGESVGSPSLGGRTALHAAAAGGHLDIASILLKSGADVASPDLHGKSPLHLAAGASAMARTECGITPLHAAAAVGQFQIARDLLKHGADVNAAAHYTSLVEGVNPAGMSTVYQVLAGTTSLHWAVHYRNADVARLLLDHGADPLSTDERGATAMPPRRANRPHAPSPTPGPGGETE